jgi:hypothetical protein
VNDTAIDPVEAMGYLALVTWWQGEPGRARRLAHDAVALSDRVRHPVSHVIALQLSSVLHYYAGETRQVLEETERIFDIIRTHGLPPGPGSFSWLHGHARVELGEVDEGFAEIRAGERRCDAIGLRIGMTGFHLHYAESCRDAGLADEASAAPSTADSRWPSRGRALRPLAAVPDQGRAAACTRRCRGGALEPAHRAGRRAYAGRAAPRADGAGGRLPAGDRAGREAAAAPARIGRIVPDEQVPVFVQARSLLDPIPASGGRSPGA